MIGRRTGDGALVARVLDGDTRAYDRLVRRHQAALFRYARGMGMDADTAEDMVQDTLVRAYTSLADCRDRDAFRAWAYRILRNRCLDYLKNIRRRDVPLDAVSPGGPERFGATPTTELRHELEDALDRLSPLLREAFLLKHEAGYSYDEMAGITDTSPSAVKMRVHRAREELRTLLHAPNEDRDVTIPRSRSSYS